MSFTANWNVCPGGSPQNGIKQKVKTTYADLYTTKKLKTRFLYPSVVASSSVLFDLDIYLFVH